MTKTASIGLSISLALTLLISPRTTLASTPDQAEQEDLLSPSAQVFLVTVGPGELVWERFGHNGLLIRDPESGFKRIYDWGRFSFEAKDFWPRFLRGEMYYAIGSEDPDLFLDFNAKSDRSIWIQEVNLSHHQKNALAQFLKENDSEGNRFYQYNYYLDNCSTRARDAIDRVLGGVIARATQSSGSGTSFRSHTRRLLQSLPSAYFGIQLGLGQPADQEISIWKATFTPMALRRHLNEIALPDGRPLILSDNQIYRSKKFVEPSKVPDRRSFFAIYGVIGGLFFVLLGYLVRAGQKWAEKGLAVCGMIWAFFAGLAGLLLSLIWFFTEHRFGHWNENLLQYNPLSIGLAFFFCLFLFRGSWSRLAILVSYGVAALSLSGFLLQILPGFNQVNTEIIVLALPIHSGLAWATHGLHSLKKRVEGN